MSGLCTDLSNDPPETLVSAVPTPLHSGPKPSEGAGRLKSSAHHSYLWREIDMFFIILKYILTLTRASRPNKPGLSVST